MRCSGYSAGGQFRIHYHESASAGPSSAANIEDTQEHQARP